MRDVVRRLLVAGLGLPGVAWGQTVCETDQVAFPLDCRTTIDQDAGPFFNDYLQLSVANTDPELLSGYSKCPGAAQNLDAERIFEFTCAQDTLVSFEFQIPDCDVDIFVLDDTCDPDQVCVASDVSAWNLPLPGGTNPPFQMEPWVCQAGRTYYVVFELVPVVFGSLSLCDKPVFRGGTNVGTGTQVLTKIRCAEDCEDDYDNDDDGSVDCEDGDCAGDPACGAAVEDCDNGTDDDGDTDVDCDDEDCFFTEVCCDRDGDDYFADTPTCGGEDCDDDPVTGPGVNPLAEDVPANGIDEDCQGGDTCYADADGDGFGDPLTLVDGGDLDCIDGGEADDPDDCDDTPGSGAAIYPGATEVVANGVDEDCDDVDVCWVDGDEDGVGGVGTAPGNDLDCTDAGESTRNDDCDDGDADRSPLKTEIPADGIDQDCVPGEPCFVDGDGDGVGTPALVPSPDLDCTAEGESALSTDCDDGDAGRSPLTAEVVADGIDQNCDDVDLCWRDGDQDGVGGMTTIASASLSCTASVLTSDRNDDCADDDSGRSPLRTEVVGNGIDEDCVAGDLCYVDADRDTYGAATTVVSADLQCLAADQEASRPGDCDDTDATVYPGAPSLPGGGNEDCDADSDLDNDGFDAIEDGGSDCNDNDPNIKPGAPEVALDEIDQNCNGVDLCARDRDGDGFGGSESVEGSDLACTPDGTVTDNRDDCDDSVATGASVFPGADEIPYDGIDQDCVDGDLIDVDRDGVPGGPAGTDCSDLDSRRRPGLTEVADGIDNDCNGKVDDGTDRYDDDGDGYAELGGDCLDDPATGATRTPGKRETANDIDDDCDVEVDEGTRRGDDDEDGFSEEQGDCNDGDANVFPGNPAPAPDGIDHDCDGRLTGVDGDRDGYAGEADCDDEDAQIFPGAPERDNDADDDCDGAVDEDLPSSDDDGDGVSEDEGDCDDADPQRVPGAPERRNGRDDDCDGAVDEGTDVYDDDGDGYTELAGDCDDADADVNPGAIEAATGKDDDCDEQVDELLEDRDGDGQTVAQGDCDDRDPWVNPEMREFCDVVDNDCDGEIDEGGICDALGVTEAPAPVTEAPETGCAVTPRRGSLPVVIAILLLGVRRRRG